MKINKETIRKAAEYGAIALTILASSYFLTRESKPVKPFNYNHVTTYKDTNSNRLYDTYKRESFVNGKKVSELERKMGKECTKEEVKEISSLRFLHEEVVIEDIK